MKTRLATGSRTVRLAVLLVVVAAIVALFRYDVLDTIGDPDRLEAFLTESGVWGPVAYVLGFVALQPVGLPGAVLIVPATLVWPWWAVFLLSLAGGMVASTVGFLLARWLGQDWVARRMPARFEPWERRIDEHGFVATVALRLVTGFAPPADWLLGVTQVSVPAFLAGTAIGLIPSTLAMSVFGDEAVDVVRRAPLAVGVAAVLAVVGYRLFRRHRRRRQTPADEPNA